MSEVASDSIRVNVPVGFLLPEEREVIVTVDRADAAPLAVRLRLVPASAAADPPQPPAGPHRPARRKRRSARDGYPLPDFGGSD